MPERRQDTEARERIAALEELYEQNTTVVLGTLSAAMERQRKSTHLLLVGMACLVLMFLATVAAEGWLYHGLQEGRRTSIGVTCAAVSAISEAGRHTIESSGPLPPGVEALLRAHGMPPLGDAEHPAPGTRRFAAQQAARDYVERISRAVDAQLGGTSDGLVRRDGTLDCRKLQRVAHTR